MLKDITGKKRDGFELITDDNQWWVIHVCNTGVQMTSLLEKVDYTFEEALSWISLHKHSVNTVELG